MTEHLPNLTELRAQARRHREAAIRETDPQKRQARLDLAAEYDKLVRELEEQQRSGSSARGASDQRGPPRA